MTPSASLQARIATFENLSSNSIRPKFDGGFKTVQSPPRPVVAADQHILDSDPISSSDPLLSFPPLKPSINPPRSSSPPVLGRKTSLIDFSELSASPRFKNDLSLSADEPETSTSTVGSTSSSTAFLDLPLKSNSQRVPPLPPRKPSQNSLKKGKGPIVNLPIRSSPISIATSKLSQPEFLPSDLTHPASNSSDGSSRHLPASSISSFQSVSLSSEGLGTPDNSLDGSYEAVSSTAATSPISKEDQNKPLTTDITKSRSKLPIAKLSLNESTLSESSSTVIILPRRRPPPPPPLSKSSITQTVSQPLTNVSALLRPVPIPINARKRYDALFERYTSPYSQKGHSTSGWRGPSLDLLTGIDIDDLNEHQQNARIHGFLVKSIWGCSRLPRSRLKEIWNECDSDRTGSLDKYAFALGMWRIDEALRGAQQSKLTIINQSVTPPLPPRTTNIAYIPRPTRKTYQK
ncbi:hypothetical protein Clacol_006778 [Clathrus columnatus]|uniref:EH domain-containing protein n=1 Tax=Clathrus columnatus TaxID=1419009 RepID=A0AAV5AKT0_9AGAM|nr:hypothetical protein Clacol_006778 [Clathrus columnatus]